VRLKVEGQRLSASFEEGAEQPGISLQVITWALQGLRVDQIEDPNDPFGPYHPGKFRQSRSPQPVDTEDQDGQHATL
jgi:hypothetical protein